MEPPGVEHHSAELVRRGRVDLEDCDWKAGNDLLPRTPRPVRLANTTSLSVLSSGFHTMKTDLIGVLFFGFVFAI